MNSCNFIGRLVKDPVTQRYAYGDKIVPVCYFNIAIERIHESSKQKYDVISIKAVGTLASTCEKHLEKGKKIGLSARVEHTKHRAPNGRWYANTLFCMTALYFVDSKGDDPSAVMSEIAQEMSEEEEGFEIDFNNLD